jgi:hypothetical protein
MGFLWIFMVTLLLFIQLRRNLATPAIIVSWLRIAALIAVAKTAFTIFLFGFTLVLPVRLPAILACLTIFLSAEFTDSIVIPDKKTTVHETRAGQCLPG